MTRPGAALLLLLAAVAPAAAEEAARPDGEAVYRKWCEPCHAPGVEHPGTHALQAKYAGIKSGVLLEWTDLTADYVRHMVRHGMSVMPWFRKTEIGDAELDALAGYLTHKPAR
jgi:mono/diheme cytochrome c family protein